MIDKWFKRSPPVIRIQMELGPEATRFFAQQFGLIKEAILAAADDVVDAIVPKLDQLATDIAREIQQLAAAIASGTITPASLDKLRLISDRISALSTDLQADDPPTTT